MDRYNKENDLNTSNISGNNDTSSTFNDTNVLHSESYLTHNGSRKRLASNNENNTFIKGKMIKKLSLFGNNNENDKKENQE